MQAKVGTFAKTTAAATASQAITGVGFEPNLVFFWLVGPTALDTWTTHIRACIGFACNEGGTIKERAVSFGVDDASANAETSRLFSNTKCININDGDTAAGDLRAAADLASFDADGFTLSWTKNEAVAYQIGYLALDVPNVAIRNFDLTADGGASISGIGFEPTALFAIANSTTTYQTTTPVGVAHGGFGAAAGGNQWAYHYISANGTASSDNATAGQSGYFMIAAPSATSGTSISNRVDLDSFDVDGISYTVSGYSIAKTVEVVLIGGVEAFAETFNKSTGAATAVQARTGYGFQPKAAIVFSGSKTTDTSVNTAHFRPTLGFSDGTNEMSGTCYDTDNLATSNDSGRMTASKVVGTVTTDTDAIAAAADLAFDGDGLTFSWTTNDANAHEIFVLALGDPPSVIEVAVADTDTITATESLAIAATVPVSDSDTVGATEAVSVAGTLSIADSDAVNATEALAIAGTLPLVDADTITVTESIDVQTSTTVPLTDADTITATDSIDVQTLAVVPVTDSDTVTATEALALAATATVSDTDTISVSESLTFANTLGASDTGTIGATETIAAAAVMSVADSDTVTATEALDVQSVAGAELGDTGTVAATESLAIVTTLAVADTDTISATETLTRAVSITVSDGDTISITEALAIITGTFLALADGDTISATEARSIAAVVTVSDEGVVGSLEILAGDFAPPAMPVPIVTPGRGGGVTMAVALWRATIDNVLVEDLSAHGVEGSVSMNLDRAIKLAASFTIPDPDRVTPYVDYLAPFLTLEFDDGSPTIARQLGLFGVRVPPATRGPDSGIATFAGEDLTTILANSAYSAPDEVPNGTLFRAELIQTIEEAGITRYSIPNTTRTTGYHRTYPPGTTRMEKVTRLTERMRMYQPYMDLEGRIATQNTFSKRVTEPYVTITDEDLLEEIQIQPSDLQIANVVIVVRDNANEAPLSGVARDDDPASPTSTITIGREIVRVVRVQELEDQADADDQAARYLEEGKSYYRTARLVTLPNARFGFHQVLDLALTGHWGALNGRWMVRAWDVGFSPESVALVQTVNQLTSTLSEEAA